MKNNTSISGNVGIQVVAAILSVVAIILGIAAFQSGNSSKNTVKELQMKLDSEISSVAQVEDSVKQLRTQTQNAVMSLSTEIVGLRDQMTKKPEAAPKEEKAKDAKGGKKEEAAPTGPGTYHTIKAGDTFGKLAKEYGTSTEAIEKLNPGVTSKNLRVGKKIRVK
jgi:LysM repeat protein